MSEHRRLRFSDILGIERSDLPFACDIWLEDINRAPWVSREVMKLSAYFVRYMMKPDANALSLREVETQIQMPPEELRKALVLMRNFNAVEGFLIERNDIRVGLKLSYMQRLRTLEARSRFAALLAEPIARNWPWTTAEERWVPGPAAVAPVVTAAVAVEAMVASVPAEATVASIAIAPVVTASIAMVERAPVVALAAVAEDVVLPVLAAGEQVPIAPSELPVAVQADIIPVGQIIEIPTEPVNASELSAA